MGLADSRITLFKRLRAHIPRSVKVPTRLALAALKGEVTIVLERGREIAENSFVIALADDLETMHTRCCYRGIILERGQSPVVSLFADYTFANLGVLPLGRADPEFYAVLFRGRSLRWFPDSGVWPPTLDSYILTRAVLDTRPEL